MSRTFTVWLDHEFISHHVAVTDFDKMVDGGVDDILIITPKGRWLSSLDDWIDYGYVDVEDNDPSTDEVRVLHRSYMGRV